MEELISSQAVTKHLIIPDHNRGVLLWKGITASAALKSAQGPY
jgi:hypothetical protein